MTRHMCCLVSCYYRGYSVFTCVPHMLTLCQRVCWSMFMRISHIGSHPHPHPHLHLHTPTLHTAHTYTPTHTTPLHTHPHTLTLTFTHTHTHHTTHTHTPSPSHTTHPHRFGSPLILRVWRDLTHQQFQSVVLKAMSTNLREGVRLPEVCRSGVLFQCRIVDGLPGRSILPTDADHPFYSQSVDK